MKPAELPEPLLALAAGAAAPGRLPESTYRLQFHAGFTFNDARAVVPYLADLGITHCYASPFLKAQPGSTHGYDITDYGRLNPEVGTPDDFDAFLAALRDQGVGQILDTVPNHMGVGTSDNAWWNDVLENGPASRFGPYFDIAWRASLRPELRDKVLLPVLAEPYGDVLEAGQLSLACDGGAFFVVYNDRRFPLAPASYATLLSHRQDELETALSPEDPVLAEFKSILTAIRNLPDRAETDVAKLEEHQREKEVIKRRLGALCELGGPVRGFVEQNIADFNGKPGDPRSFDLLEELLEQQCYRLAYWRVAPDEINYRRFFDVNGLAALSMEREEVFEATHGLILKLLAEGKASGLRIDHPDGLYDPALYLRRLQQHHVLARARLAFEAGPALQGLEWKEVEAPLRAALAAGRLESEESNLGPPLYVMVEKILGAQESLPADWAVHGTTGYDFLNQVNGLFVDGANADAFQRLYQQRVDDNTPFPELVYRKKLLILQMSLSSELHMLTLQLDRLAQKQRRSRDFTFNTLRQALREVIACFPVYRSYTDDDGAHDADRRHVDQAVRRAVIRNPLMNRRVFRFIREMLVGDSAGSCGDLDRAERRRFAGKFQQVTAPVTAKGVEDTAFYIYNRLVSLNEVGGEPDRFGVRPEALHSYNQGRQGRSPYALSPLSTHDTKRGEDVRARINVLSEIPEDWAACVDRWSQFNRPHRRQVEDLTAPDANEEYQLYQTLIGAWPLGRPSAQEYEEFVKRIQAYMLKALHEAKVHSSWINPDPDYDQAVQEFVRLILDEGASGRFLDDFRAFQRRVSHYGLLNSLSQTLLKLASPGVPDTYQGTELWDLSLVDPDNRRPVDYRLRREMLTNLQSAVADAGDDLANLCRELLAAREDGRIKLYIHHRALHCRRDHAGLLSAGEYVPINASGSKAGHVFAFLRTHDHARALIAVPRLWARLLPDPVQWPLGKSVWQDTRLLLEGVDPASRWRNVFTAESLVARDRDGQPSLAAAEVFAHFPIALFLSERAP